MSKFSIVITTFNRLPLLRRAVESALAQTWPCEVIVADNGSTDGTQDYVRSLGDRVIYHRSPTNLGHSGAMNAGVSLAQGDWIKPVDDDDYLAPHCIERMALAIAQRPQAVLCSCQAIQVDAHGLEITRTHPSGTGNVFYVPQEDIHYGMLLEIVPFGTPIQVAFRKDAFLKSGGWDLSLNVCDDIDSWIKIAKYGDAIFLNEYLAYRTLWPGGNNQQFSWQKRLEINMQIKEKIYPLVAQKYRSSLPKLRDINAFLKLHWSLVALKGGHPFTALPMAYPAVFSPGAWKLLATVVYVRRIACKTESIRQQILPSDKSSEKIFMKSQVKTSIVIL